MNHAHKTSLLVLLLVAACAAARAKDPDPTASDGDKYHVVLENERVRVLRYHDRPGDKTQMHHHPHDFVVVPLAPFRRRLGFADGSTRELSFQTGQVTYLPEQSHTGENIGSADTDSILVELKSCSH